MDLLQKFFHCRNREACAYSITHAIGVVLALVASVNLVKRLRN